MGYGARVHEVELLEDHADIGTDFLQLKVTFTGNLEAVHGQGAAGGALQPVDQAHQGGFARTRVADNREDLTLLDGEGNVFDGGNFFLALAENFGDVINRDHGLGAGIRCAGADEGVSALRCGGAGLWVLRPRGCLFAHCTLSLLSCDLGLGRNTPDALVLGGAHPHVFTPGTAKAVSRFSPSFSGKFRVTAFTVCTHARVCFTCEAPILLSAAPASVHPGRG